MAAPSLILGFDYGRRRIGVACGNTLTQSAQPLVTLTRGLSSPWGEIGRIIDEFSPSQLVVGLPYNMDGSETALTPEVRAFADELRTRFKRPVDLVDERLSSRAAESELRDARSMGHKRTRVVRDDVDMVAAKVLVEQWLRGTSSPK